MATRLQARTHVPLCATYTFTGLVALSFILLASCLLPEEPTQCTTVHTVEGVSPFLTAGGRSLSQPPCHPAVVVAMADGFSSTHV